MKLHLLQAVVSLLFIVHVKDLHHEDLIPCYGTLMSLSATHSPSVFLCALNTYENFPCPICLSYLINTNEFYDLKAIDLLADEVLNLDSSSGACHDYIIQIY
jgi:hypothetical protein